jgi:hypothetical protein
MEHTTESLILAAHVRELASSARDKKLADEMRSWDLTNPEPKEGAAIGYDAAQQSRINQIKQARDAWRANRDLHKEQWLRENSVSTFAKAAFAQIKEVADALNRP